MASKSKQLQELSKRIEAALGILDRRVDVITFLIQNGRVKRKEIPLFQAERDVLVAVVDALRAEQHEPRKSAVQVLGKVGLTSLLLANSIATGGLESIGASATQQAVDAVEAMIDAAAQVSPDEQVQLHSDEEIDGAIESLSRYQPATREEVPWDGEEERWLAPVIDIWDVVNDELEDSPESLRREVVEVLIERGLSTDWVPVEWLNSMHE